MNHFPIKTFSGIETNVDGTDQDRGTLQVAEAVVLAPERALASPPTWAVAWGLSALATSMNTALSGASGSLVHFATIEDAVGNKFLIAWDKSTSSCRGLWCVATGTSAPDFSSGSGVTITATNNSTYRDKTAATPWFGTWAGQRLLLGNGVDSNLVWSAGALAMFNAATSSTADPSQSTLPACTCFCMGPNGHIYAAGNASAPLRVWITDPPSVAFPTITGLLTSDRSFVDINRRNLLGAGVTALSPASGGVIAHLGAGGAVWIGTPGAADDGNLAEQRPLDNVCGAANPACVGPWAGATYFGADLELYQSVAHQAPAYGRDAPRSPQIETWKSAGQWDRAFYRGNLTTAQPFILHDTRNDRTWLTAPLALRQLPGTYCFDERSKSITGPIAYPMLTQAAPLLDQNLAGASQPEANGAPFVVVAVSAAGVLLYADLGKIGELALDSIGTAIGANYSAAALQPTPTAGLCCIGVYNGGQSFARVDSAGRCDLLADVWGDWASNGTTVPTITEWYNNAQLAIIEFSAEDFGSPVREKDFCEIRPQWRRNQRVYAGAWVESDQQTDGQWIGTPYPAEEMVVPVCIKGTRLKTRLAVVVFNGAPSILPDLSIGILEGGPR